MKKNLIGSAVILIAVSAVAALAWGFLVAGDEHGYQRGFSEGQLAGVLEGSAASFDELEALRFEVDALTVDGLVPWHSVEEVTWWLQHNTISNREYEAETYDCDNFAIDLAVSAAMRGRVLGIMWEDQGTATHLSNFAIIGNDLYRIAPENNALYWLSYVDSAQ